ncbi:MAG: family 43 glycosylhydrolase [Bacteroidales bacterium]|nr:family 43 glycosylhydrolase [Bacteroidales bacterium]
MKNGNLITAIAALLLALLPSGARAQVLYGNPVIGLNCPDPSVLDDRERSGCFYAYTTQTSFESALKKDSSPVVAGARVINLPIYRSTDLVNWEFVGDGFPGGHPDWVKDANLWAPTSIISMGSMCSITPSANGEAYSVLPAA